MSLDLARQVADTVLYEGYVLYPYRASAKKNRVRFQFGVVAPRTYAETAGAGEEVSVSGAAEPWATRTECLVEPDTDADITIRVRFLQVQARTVEEATADGGFRPVESLEADGSLLVAFDEAVERQVEAVVSLRALCAGARVVPFEVEGGEAVEPVGSAGRVVRRREALSGRLVASAEVLPGPYGVVRLRVETENLTPWEAGPEPVAARDDAVRHSLVSAHTLLHLSAGRFISLLEPPEWAAPYAQDCSNLHTWPVLVGAGDDIVLSSPIILYDHPDIAPESPGDLFDATEIDEILSLRTLALTDEEKAEARATDPRAKAIIDRIDNMPQEIWGRLHGAVRGLRQETGTAAVPEDVIPTLREPVPGVVEGVPWWDPGRDASVSPETDSVLIRGVEVARGSRVRLCPGQRPCDLPGALGAMRATDAQDLFLEGRTARVQAVYFDVDGDEYLAVNLEDDPAAEIQQWHGRFFYFHPDEVEPLEAGE